MDAVLTPRQRELRRIERRFGRPTAIAVLLLTPLLWLFFKAYDLLQLGEPVSTRTLKVVEWTGAILGLIGAALLALKIPGSGYGFLAYLVSNVCWLWFGVKTRSWGMVTMQVGFTVTTFVGINNWLM